MLNTEKLEKLKESKWVSWVAKCIIPAMLLFLMQWHWTLNDRIARLEENTKQDRAQWSAIKQVSDNDEEQEVRLRVTEKIQDWSIMAGILKTIATEEDLEPVENPGDVALERPVVKPRLDVQKIFDRVKKEKAQQPKKEVDRYIQQQMAE